MKKCIWTMVAFAITIFVVSTCFYYIRSPKINKVEQSPRLVKHLKDLGAEVPRINIKYSNETSTGGRFDTDLLLHRTIYVAAGQPYKEERVTVAHEYLHYVYSSRGWSDNEALNSLIKKQEVDSRVQKSMALENYVSCGERCQLDELHSYICTLSEDSKLSDDMRAHCNSLIPNRQLLFSL